MGWLDSARAFCTSAVALTTALACSAEGEPRWVYERPEPWAVRPAYRVPDRGLIVVPNSYDDTLSLLDPLTLALLARVPVGFVPLEREGLHHVVVSPDGQHLFVALSEAVPSGGDHAAHAEHGLGEQPGYVLKIRAGDGTLEARVRVDRSPGDLVLSPDGARAYVSHFDLRRIDEVAAAGGSADAMRSTIAVLDTERMAMIAQVPVCRAAHGLALTPDGGQLLVACYGDDRLAILDTSAPAESIAYVALGPDPGALPETLRYGPYALLLDRETGFAWVSCWASGDVRAVDVAAAELRPERTFVTGGQPGFGQRVGDRLVFARQSGDVRFPEDRLVLANADGSGVVEHALDASRCRAAHAAYAWPGAPDKVLVVCEGDHEGPGSIVRVDVSSGAIEASSEVGVFPDAAAWIGGRP